MFGTVAFLFKAKITRNPSKNSFQPNLEIYRRFKNANKFYLWKTEWKESLFESYICN